MISRQTQKKLHQQKWFEWWLSGLPCKPLGLAKSVHPETIRKIVLENLKTPPSDWSVPNAHSHMIIDGVWFGRNQCVVVYWDVDLKRIQRSRYTNGERMEEIVSDLLHKN